MSIDTIASAINGRFVPLGEHHGFLESSFAMPGDGTLLGAYLFDGGRRIRVTDDGDTLFRASVAGVELSPSRLSGYRRMAKAMDVDLLDTGELTCEFDASHANSMLPRYFEAIYRIALESLKHRQRDDACHI